ncbi:hypothetical protein F8388_021159 [Cannabis sativa]|uniref:peroxidase n=1 Tax=Cannabis sativa TaxID=3483 RepID=A0A7J6GEZ0_CANSA|nr:hypothetical protein F8388_021159 [Cannabis sativa]
MSYHCFKIGVSELCFVVITASLLMSSPTSVNAQLSQTFYASTCPLFVTTVRQAMRQAVQKEPRMAASILRLFFHDCFVNANCPFSGGDTNLAPFDTTQNRFDNDYFKQLINKRGLLHSDQELFNGGSQDSLVTTYSTSPLRFFNDFASAMVKMGNISPLTGTNGQIRKSCGVVN